MEILLDEFPEVVEHIICFAASHTKRNNHKTMFFVMKLVNKSFNSMVKSIYRRKHIKPNSYHIVDYAVTYNFPNLLQWAIDCKFYVSKLEIKKAIRQNNIPLVKIMKDVVQYTSTARIYLIAAEHCDLENFKLIIEYFGNENMKDSAICNTAALNGNFELLKWLHQRGYSLDNSHLCIRAVDSGNIDILKWAREQGCDWDPSVCLFAALDGHDDILKWARENGCGWNAATFDSAVKYIKQGNNNFKIIKWLLSEHCPIGDPCAYAAMNGHLKLLIWLVKRGFIPDIHALNATGAGGHKEVVKYLKQFGLRFDEYSIVSHFPSLEIMKWALGEGIRIDHYSVRCLVQENDMKSIKWVHSYVHL